MLYVVKRDGREVKFDSNKIINAIKSASDEVGEQLGEEQISECIQRIIEYIEVAQKEIYKSANMQHKITSSLKNLLWDDAERVEKTYQVDPSNIVNLEKMYGFNHMQFSVNNDQIINVTKYIYQYSADLNKGINISSILAIPLLEDINSQFVVESNNLESENLQEILEQGVQTGIRLAQYRLN